MTCIDSLAGAINHFPGGLVLVSHDFRLIGQVAKEIWVCDNKSVGPWKVRSAARRRGGAGRGVARRGAARWRAALRCAAVELERALRRVRAHEVAGGELDLRHGGIRPGCAAELRLTVPLLLLLRRYPRRPAGSAPARKIPSPQSTATGRHPIVQEAPAQADGPLSARRAASQRRARRGPCRCRLWSGARAGRLRGLARGAAPLAPQGVARRAIAAATRDTPLARAICGSLCSASRRISGRGAGRPWQRGRASAAEGRRMPGTPPGPRLQGKPAHFELLRAQACRGPPPRLQGLVSPLQCSPRASTTSSAAVSAGVRRHDDAHPPSSGAILRVH